MLMESKPVKPSISRILVVKFGSLGDIVHCLPSVPEVSGNTDSIGAEMRNVEQLMDSSGSGSSSQ